MMFPLLVVESLVILQDMFLPVKFYHDVTGIAVMVDKAFSGLLNGIALEENGINQNPLTALWAIYIEPLHDNPLIPVWWPV